MPNPLQSYVYKHPELPRSWHALAEDEEEARTRFEDCWALRVHAGTLEEVNGSFFDGVVTVSAMPVEEDLCPNDLTGHFWSLDDRPARTEVPTNQAKLKTHEPVLCILCQATSWRRRASA